MKIHEHYMQRVLELAKKGWGNTNPNPLVGALIVKEGRTISEGYHKSVGCAHAEAVAINISKCDIRGATLYVNLEPCSHFGRTPPCADEIVKAKIGEVIIAMEDPNPKVSGRGIQRLKDAGIKVTVGILENDARKLNEIFIKYIARKNPFVIMKTAMTLDGKIATQTGDSKWISGVESRQHVHIIRERVSAIMVGINTVLADNPTLTARVSSEKGKDPVRIIIDSKGVIPIKSRVINTNSTAGVILAATSAISHDKEQQLIGKGVKVLKLNGYDGYVNLKELMNQLYKMEFDSILLEGGGGINASALNEKIVDKAMFFIAPKIIGGDNAKTPVEGKGIHLMNDAINLRDKSIYSFGDDIMIEGYIDYENNVK